MPAAQHAYFLFIFSQLHCSVQVLMAFSPTLSEYIADLQLTVTGFGICVQDDALKQSPSRQPGRNVCRRHFKCKPAATFALTSVSGEPDGSRQTQTRALCAEL